MKLKMKLALVISIFSALIFSSSTKIFAFSFIDDFEAQNFDKWTIISGSALWTFMQESTGNHMAGANSSATSIEVQAGDFTWTNYELSLDVLPENGWDRNLFFRVENQRSFLDNLNIPVGYGLHFSPDWIDLQKWSPGVISNPDLKRASYIWPNGTKKKLVIRVVGNNIKVFVPDNVIPILDYTDNTNPILTGRIALVITTGGVSPSEVWFDNVKVTSIDSTPTPTATPTPTPTPSPSPTPTPTPSPTPTPTPTPTPIPTPTPSPSPTPTPVKKVFLIPGMGASWNVDAMINCKNSDYAGGWTLAPYAKDIYDQLLTALPSKGWSVIPFYYDWRQDIRSNTPLLNNLINSYTSGGEKVDLVGHSMGGLIGENYLESQSGGKAAKFLAVGAPSQGSALAYPAVINGEIWANDLMEKIAATLLFKHCGISPSFKNILPTYNYLRDSKTKQLKEVSSMKTQNNFLPTNFVSDFWGVKVGTLAGTGQPTLKTINVVKDFAWPDGKPVGRENVNEGDGTVLVQSAQIPGAFSNDVINQSHSEIVASTEGVNKILDFLGSPGIADPPYSGNSSALVLVGYPGNFWITDKNGVTTQSENGMVAIMNPKDGDYQLQIVPTSATTNFIVGQFLPNGKTEYKEYKFSGLTQELKIIEFDSKHPKEDILHEIKEYKTPKIPNFPKFWFSFWNFWNKFHK